MLSELRGMTRESFETSAEKSSYKDRKLRHLFQSVKIVKEKSRAWSFPLSKRGGVAPLSPARDPQVTACNQSKSPDSKPLSTSPGTLKVKKNAWEAAGTLG